MRATFLDHSGFLVELPGVTLLFDWWKGELPALRPGVPLLVFSSHRHEDHFNPEIFRLNADAFLLGSDIRLTGRNLEKWGISKETAARCVRLGKMVDEATAMGADAIINIRFGSSAVMQGAAEVIAYGTAVKLK